MKQETIAALQQLYSDSAVPICAVTPQFQLLWKSDDHASELLHELGRQLGGAETTEEVPIPPDHTVVLSYVVPPVLCRIEELSEEGEPYLVVRFQPASEQRVLDLPETRALLHAQVTTGRQAVISVLQAFHKMEETLRANQIAADSAVVRLLHEACYAMLNRDARCDELPWYETLGNEEARVKFGSINLTSELSRFLHELHDVTDGLIHIEAADIASDLFAEMEPRRFQFAMLAMFVLLQDGNPERTGFSISAKSEADRIQIVQTLRRIEPSEENPLPFHKRTMPDGTLLSEDAVLRRFCAAFGARYTVLTKPEEISGILTLPAAKPPKTRAELCAGLARYSSGRCTLTHVMLSAVISAEYFYDGDI